MSEVHVCIHAHFYQPPRENPWLEVVEPESSANPYHDWNERITAECYAPNGAARIMDGEGRIQSIRNNYASISFNFGPTLLGWMESEAPSAYAAILEADVESMDRFDGHGSALAQPYNHMIMPLASPRDRRTQVAWGIADFRRRFRRDPEGMWLPETAVDLDTLEALAEAGVRFTVLAPHQAARVRPPGSDWREVGAEGPDTSVAYRQELPSGREIALFFYDGPTSRAVAFESLLDEGEAFAGRLMELARSRRESGAGLVHIATDGETYGHHHAHGDMALAVALGRIEAEAGLRLSNYAMFLAEHPPRHEVDVREGTSWSCAHGLERWRADCGCSTGGEDGWNQAWRAPLRQALDALTRGLADGFLEEGATVLRDPWAARDAYIGCVLGAEPERRDFLVAWFKGSEAGERRLALELLEMQRCAMLMHTSCGWFFNDLAGIETRQILRYAARALDLAESAGVTGLREPFLAALSQAVGNGTGARNGRELLEREIEVTRVSAPDIAADWIARRLADVPQAEGTIWRVDGFWAAASAPGARAVAARVEVSDVRTGASCAFRCKGRAAGPDLRLRIEPDGPGGGGVGRYRSLADLPRHTRAEIERSGPGADGRGAVPDRAIADALAAIERLGEASAADTERLLSELIDLLDGAGTEALEGSRWQLQNAWWGVTRDRARHSAQARERVGRLLGFAD